MALVKELKKIDKQIIRKHEEVECTYCSTTTNRGEKLLQLETYGTLGRVIPGKVSQNIQFDEEGAEKLYQIIANFLGK